MNGSGGMSISDTGWPGKAYLWRGKIHRDLIDEEKPARRKT